HVPRQFFVAGLLAGLAGMAHLYGLFWLAAFALVLFWDTRFVVLRRRPLYLIALGALLAWTPWLIYIAFGWPDFVAQTSNYANRFDLFNVQFYVDTVLGVAQRQS